MQCKSVSTVTFLICTWPNIFAPQNRCMMSIPTRTLRSSYARFELAMGMYHALSWKGHHTHPKGICPMSITKMCVVPTIDTSFLGSEGKKKSDTTSVLSAIKAKPDLLSSLIWPWIGHPALYSFLPKQLSKSSPFQTFLQDPFSSYNTQREGKMKDFNMDNYKSYLSSLDVPNGHVVMFTSNISPHNLMWIFKNKTMHRSISKVSLHFA